MSALRRYGWGLFGMRYYGPDWGDYVLLSDHLEDRELLLGAKSTLAESMQKDIDRLTEQLDWVRVREAAKAPSLRFQRWWRKRMTSLGLRYWKFRYWLIARLEGDR